MGTLTNSGATTVERESDRQKIATINEMAQILDDMIGGKIDIVTTGGTTTLTGTHAAPQSQHAFLNISGILASNAIIQIPAVAAGIGRCRIYAVKNGTSGAFTVTVRAVGQTGVTVTQTKKKLLLFNGTDIENLTAEI